MPQKQKDETTIQSMLNRLSSIFPHVRVPVSLRPFFSATLLTSLLPLECLAQSASENNVTSVVQSAMHPQFTPPQAGTYTLPPINTVNDHQLLDSTGKRVSLFNLTAEKIAIVSFMYTSCAEVGGCPLAAAVLQHLDRRLSKRPELARQVTLLSVSFDPERDTPARLAEVREALGPRTQWRFLTGGTAASIQPILTDFDQSVAKLWHDDGSWSGLFRHVLKVFLIDTKHQVRNIYSSGFLNAQLVLNDIETLLLEARHLDEHSQEEEK